MWIPLAILAVLSLVGGYINIPKFLEPMFPLAGEGGNEWTVYVSVAFGLGGIALAFLFYVVAPAIPDALERGFRPIYTLVYNKYFVDEFYGATVVDPTVDGSRTLLWRITDVRIIDGAVNGIGKLARATGGLLKRAQSGYIRDYAGWVVAGSIVVILAMAFMGGAR
jgi:NADH-quinone oxidoreductase subunit L